jgi:hypothetical protein
VGFFFFSLWIKLRVLHMLGTLPLSYILAPKLFSLSHMKRYAKWELRLFSEFFAIIRGSKSVEVLEFQWGSRSLGVFCVLRCYLLSL